MYVRGDVIALVLCALADAALGAKRVDAHMRARETLRRRRDQRQLHDDVPLNIPDLLQLTKGESLQNIRETSDVYGMTVERLQETYHGIKVHDTAVTIHKTKDGHLTGEAVGTFVQDIEEDLPNTEAKLSNEDVLMIAMNNEGDNIKDISNAKYSIEIYLDENNEARLVNVLSYLIEGRKRPHYIIDAQTGDILKNWQGLNNYPCCQRKYNATGGNVKGGKITYGNMPYCLTPNITNGICYLENEYVKVIDMDKDSYNTANFVCSEGYKDEVNGAYSPATDVFFHGTVVGKMFEEWFDTTPFGDRDVILQVHAGYSMENAYWNGEYCSFGDGYNTFYPLTTLDIVGHEIGHGVTEFNSDLQYYGESGGINEAFSDIMGEAAEYYLLEADMLTGGTVMKNDPYLREFERPENDNSSIGHVDDMSSYTDVHYSSGIYRRIWFVLIEEEGVPVRDAFSVFLHANKMYWHESSSFYDASCGLLKAAVDLGSDIRPYRKAFKDVGIDYCPTVSSVLQNNETLYGIIVSNNNSPDFMMETPHLAESLVVEVKSNISKDIIIDVAIQNETNGHLIEKQGTNNVQIPNAGGKIFYFKLSLSHEESTDECDEVEVNNNGNEVAEVSINARFSCRSSPNSDEDDDDIIFSGSGNNGDDDSSSGSGDTDDVHDDDDDNVDDYDSENHSNYSNYHYDSYEPSSDYMDSPSFEYDDYFSNGHYNRRRRSNSVVASC